MLLLPLFSAAAAAAYLQDVPVTVSQPNGDTLNCLASGDEFFNYLHDAHGNIIIQHPLTGYYTYAQLDARGKLTASLRAAANNGYYYNTVQSGLYSPAYAISAGTKVSDIDFAVNTDLISEYPQPAPQPLPDAAADIGKTGKIIQGSMENIVVMICFADENPAIDPVVREKIENLCNAPALSLSHYIKTVSQEALELHSTLVGLNGDTVLMYQDSHPRAYFTPYNAVTNPLGYMESQRSQREHTLLNDAVKAIDGSPLLSGKNLDINGTGYIDSITFIASGSVGAWSDLLWPHKSVLFGSEKLNGKKIDAYTFHLLNSIFSFYGSVNLGVLCHEALHIFQFPDLYRYTYNGDPVGVWDVMAINAVNPQLPNSHSRLRYAGWGPKLEEITESGRYTLHPLGSAEGLTAYAIGTSNPNEFILLEYRSNGNGSGYDSLFGTSNTYNKGLTITRINIGYSGNENRGGSTNDEVYVYRNGETALNKGDGIISTASLSAESGRTSFGNDTAASGYSGTIYIYNGDNTKHIITNVSAAGETISFDVQIVFVPVADILNVPYETMMGDSLPLSGTVLPFNAANKSIIWGVKEAGATGASIDGNVLHTTAPGIAVITATVADGTAPGTPFSKDFTVTVEAPFISVTDITDVPGQAMPHTPLTLSGTVLPLNATKQDIIWSVKDAGSTGATIAGGVLTATATGTVTITATVEGGQPGKVKIAAGGSHTADIQTDGSLWAWGQNNNGQMGDDTIIGKAVPVRVGTDNDWVSVSAVGSSTLALKRDGSLWAWGRNIYSLLGDGTNIYKTIPVRVGTDNDWSAVALGYYHAMGLKSDGSLWAWGDNTFYQLGDGTMIPQAVPVRFGEDNDWSAVSAGAFHTMALKADGSLWAWGRNHCGQLGDGTDKEKSTSVQVGTDNDWAALAAGYTYTAALKSDGSLWTWGYNNCGQLGDGTNANKNTPVRVGADNDWSAVSAGQYYALATKKDGSLWAWGDNANGQLGDGTNISSNIPVRIGQANDWTAVSAGSTHATALKSDGKLWAWGRNNYGQLGDGTKVNKNTPKEIIADTSFSKNFIITVIAPSSGFTVSGLVKSYDPKHDTTLQLFSSGAGPGETAAAYTIYVSAAQTGSGQREQEFSFAGVEPGLYTLVVSKEAHTDFIVHNIVVDDQDVDLTEDVRPEVQLMTMRCGDINGDGNINNSDLTILWQQANYNRSAEAADEQLCDLNGDGLINNIDLTILWLAYNYNRGTVEIE
jgi:M6 family metalloprotease-like protein